MGIRKLRLSYCVVAIQSSLFLCLPLQSQNATTTPYIQPATTQGTTAPTGSPTIYPTTTPTYLSPRGSSLPPRSTATVGIPIVSNLPTIDYIVINDSEHGRSFVQALHVQN